MGEVKEAKITAPLAVNQPTPEELIQGGAKKERLGAWYAIAICGNDITSSFSVSIPKTIPLPS